LLGSAGCTTPSCSTTSAASPTCLSVSLRLATLSDTNVSASCCYCCIIRLNNLCCPSHVRSTQAPHASTTSIATAPRLQTESFTFIGAASDGTEISVSLQAVVPARLRPLQCTSSCSQRSGLAWWLGLASAAAAQQSM
jgi:hypothetical protein